MFLNRHQEKRCCASGACPGAVSDIRSIGIASRPDIPSINAMLAERMPELAAELCETVATSRNLETLRFGRRGSLAVIVAGSKRGCWHDHETGCGGDPLGLVAHLRRIPMRDAYKWALAWIGRAPIHLHLAPTIYDTGQRQAPLKVSSSTPSKEMARRIWREAVPAAGTLAEAYLASRGLMLPDDAPLAFHPDCPRGAERWPAMLALMTDVTTGEAVGVHRTFLARDGSGKAPGVMPAKMMTGNAGVIRLTPDADVTTGLGVAEGIETALAVMQRAIWSPVWAATSAGAVSQFPVLSGVEVLTLFADMDSAGMTAARACGQRWAAAGREARLLAPPSGDWDNALPRTRGNS